MDGSQTPKLLVLAGCAIAVGTVAASAIAQTRPPPTVMIDGVSSHAERIDLSRWIDETQAVLRSPAFLQNLATAAASYSAISIGNATRTPQQVNAIVATNGSPFRYYPTSVALVGNQNTDEVLTGHTGETIDGVFTVATRIGRRHLVRYRSANQVERSCAINTLAHELSHTISDHPQWSQLVLEDTGTTATVGGTTPIATYLIGSVAQCTYLQAQGRTIDLGKCVATFGVSEFWNTRCASFGPTATIEPPAPRP